MLLVIMGMQPAFQNENTRGLAERIKDFAETAGFRDVVATLYGYDGRIVPELDGVYTRAFSVGTTSCWTRDFVRWVEAIGSKTIVFVGVDVGGTILHSAYDADDRLFNVRVVSDLFTHKDRAVRDAAILLMQQLRKGVCVVDSAHMLNKH